VICGSVMGSFAVERFGIDRLLEVTTQAIEERVRAFREMTTFEHPLPVGADV
jgi:hypothetical protein